MSSKKMISIAKKHREEVLGILNTVDNISEFVCLAIIEKHDNDKNPMKSTSKDEVREIVKEVIGELNSDDLVIVKGSKNLKDIDFSNYEKKQENQKENNNDDDIPNARDILKRAENNNDKIETEDFDVSEDVKDVIGGW